MNYNNEFLQMDTPSKAYLLGLLYADGCISGKRTSVFLTEKDGYLLKYIHEEFNFFRLNKRKVYKSDKNTQPGYVLETNIKKVSQDLLLSGMRSRKSYENKEQLFFPILEKELIGSFIRGFFDGDGSVYTNPSRPNSVHVEMCCVSHLFISELKLKLQSFGIESKLYIKQPNEKDRKQIIYRLFITKSADVIKFKELIYSDKSFFYLVRKKERLDKCQLLPDSRIKNVKELNRNFNCPYCNSDYIILGEVRDMKWGKAQRLKCKSCNKWHTIPYQENIAHFPRTGKMKR